MLTSDQYLNQIVVSDALAFAQSMPDESVNCVVTSPPYFGLRDYGTADWEGGDPECDHRVGNQVAQTKAPGAITAGIRPGTDATHCKKCGAIRIDQQMGLEETPSEYVANLVNLFREIRRVLRSDGTAWLNIGDSYARTAGDGSLKKVDTGLSTGRSGKQKELYTTGNNRPAEGFKPKDLYMIPFRVALALQEDGWYVRSDIIWHKCLSGGVWVYAKTQKGETPMMVRDIARLDPSTVKLWNGQAWTQVTGLEKLARNGEEFELVLRSGERISCTPEHRWPTNRGLLYASELRVGDILEQVCLPEPSIPYAPPIITLEAAWFIGLYLAEGSRSGGCIQISGHADEMYRVERLQNLAAFYGGSLAYDVKGNNLSIRLYGRFLNAIVDQYISGRTARDKCLAPRAWSHSNDWLSKLLDGYLSGDGYYDELNNRWRVGFTRNYNLERDLRVLSARLGFRLVLNLAESKIGEKAYKTFRGEIRFIYGKHHNSKPTGEIVEIRKSRCREVYDISVADDPHLFCLASGILTHNSNPMPESVKDRPTKAHEYIFLLTKSERYYYDWEAIQEPIAESTGPRMLRGVSAKHKNINGAPGQTPHSMNQPRPNARKQDMVGKPTYTGFNERWKSQEEIPAHRNKRTVWRVPTQPFKGSHFATFPPELIRPMILAGCPKGGLVYDPFMGAGTTALVAWQEGRSYTGSELNPDYAAMARARVKAAQDAVDVYALPLFKDLGQAASD